MISTKTKRVGPKFIVSFALGNITFVAILISLLMVPSGWSQICPEITEHTVQGPIQIVEVQVSDVETFGDLTTRGVNDGPILRPGWDELRTSEETILGDRVIGPGNRMSNEVIIEGGVMNVSPNDLIVTWTDDLGNPGEQVRLRPTERLRVSAPGVELGTIRLEIFGIPSTATDLTPKEPFLFVFAPPENFIEVAPEKTREFEIAPGNYTLFVSHILRQFGADGTRLELELGSCTESKVRNSKISEADRQRGVVRVELDPGETVSCGYSVKVVTCRESPEGLGDRDCIL